VVAATTAGLSSSMFYLAAYGIAIIGAFAVVTLVRDQGGEAGHLSRWAGLGRRSPLVAGIFAFFLITFAGIPLTSGFTGKFAVFEAGVSGGVLSAVIIGVISSAILAFPYVRVIVLMFFSDPAPDGPAVVRPSMFTAVAVGIGVIVTLWLGIAPEPLLSLANHAATQLFVH
jgi:NADH-quinone oxidoreductase subunit N